MGIVDYIINTSKRFGPMLWVLHVCLFLLCLYAVIKVCLSRANRIDSAAKNPNSNFDVDIAIVVSDDYFHIEDDDALVQELKALCPDLTIYKLAWDDESVDWDRVRMAVIRSAWDYHEDVDNFMLWAQKLKWSRCQLFNPSRTVIWNAKKTYLFDLEQWKVPIVPTELIRSGSDFDAVRSAAEGRGWHRVILKPTFGASSSGVIQFDVLDTPPTLQERVRKALVETDHLLQPKLSSIHSLGELSIICFHNKVSHAVRKTPQKEIFGFSLNLAERWRLWH